MMSSLCVQPMFSAWIILTEVRNLSLKILLGNARSMQHELGCILWYWATVKFIYIMNTLYMHNASIEFHRCCKLIEVQLLSSLAMLWIQMPDKDSCITASHNRESFCKHCSCVRA